MFTLDTPLGTYTFKPYPIDASWNDCGGIYMFVMVDARGTAHIQYIGLCDSFKSRLCGHDRWDAAKRAGATLVYACSIANADVRAAVEKHLIGRFNPPLNTHHTSAASRLTSPLRRLV